MLKYYFKSILSMGTVKKFSVTFKFESIFKIIIKISYFDLENGQKMYMSIKK